MSPDQQSGRSLHDAMQHTSDSFGPHRTDLVRRATARGRRLRLVRRAQIGAVAAAVAGVAALGATQLPFLAAPAPPTAVTPAPTLTPAPTATPTPTRLPSASPPAGGPRTGPMSAQLAAFLPPGTTTRLASRGSFVDGRIIMTSDGSSAAQGFVVHDDGKGRAAVSVSVLDTDLHDLTCAQPTDPLFCDVLADGTVVKAKKSRLAGGQLSWNVSAMRPNGRRVEVSEFNTDVVPYDNPTAAVTRAEPPLTIDQLQAIALSPHWDR